MLMGAAEIPTGMKGELHGKVKFIFRLQQEGAPRGERGGAGSHGRRRRSQKP